MRGTLYPIADFEVGGNGSRGKECWGPCAGELRVVVVGDVTTETAGWTVARKGQKPSNTVNTKNPELKK